MNLALGIADGFRRVLLPFLIGATVLMLVMLTLLIVQRFIRGVIDRRHARLCARYQPLVDRIIEGREADALPVLKRAPSRHRGVIGELTLNSIRALSGAPVARAGSLLRALGLELHWREDLRDRRWWRRAAAVRAIGLVSDNDAFEPLVDALDDPHEEVRAAAVDALGRLGDPRAIAPLIDRLPDQSRNQRVRIVDALRQLGQSAGDALLAFVRERPERLPLVADVLAGAAGTAAVKDLMAWCADAAPAVRSAAMSALGTVGLDDQSYYYALRALTDEDAGVRAMAARALGRSGCADAAEYLAERLADEWSVAAHSARALARLSSAGRDALQRRATEPGQAGELARQMLWEAGIAIA